MENNTVEQSEAAAWARKQQVVERRGGDSWAEGWNAAMRHVAENLPAQQAPLRARIETLEAALERIDELTDAGRDADLVNSIARNALGRKG